MGELTGISCGTWDLGFAFVFLLVFSTFCSFAHPASYFLHSLTVHYSLFFMGIWVNIYWCEVYWVVRLWGGACVGCAYRGGAKRTIV